MSYALTKAAFRINVGGSSNKIVMLAIAWMADEGGRCAISNAVLSHWTNLNEKTVSKAVRELEAMRLVSTEPAGRGRLFTLHVDLLPEFTEPDAHGQATCSYCGVAMVPMEMDHVIPRARGGSDDRVNLVIACAACNSEKGALMPEEWQPI